MSKRFTVDRDAVTGAFSTIEYNDAADEYVVNQGQVVDHIFEQNKLEYNADKVLGTGKDGFGQKVASIPLHIYFDLRKKGIVQDPKAFARWLNDPENRGVRTAPGSV